MPLDNKGGFHLHPGAASMHNAAPKAPPIGKKSGEGEAGPKGHVELHHGPPPDGSMPHAKFHTIHHSSSSGGGGVMGQEHGGGHEVKGHASLHEAHHAINEHMGEDGCSDGSCAEHGGTGEAAAGAENQAAGTGTDDEY